MLFATEIRKVTDIKDCAGSTSSAARWVIDGRIYTYSTGDDFLRCGKEFWQLPKPDKREAKKMLLSLL